MIDLQPHIYRTGPHQSFGLSEDDLENTEVLRRKIEPWLTAVFQSEHLSLLLGNGFPTAITLLADGTPADMTQCEWGAELKEQVDEYARATAVACGRGTANIEDQIRAALQLVGGLRIMKDPRADTWEDEINAQMKRFIESILETERHVLEAPPESQERCEDFLVSLLLSFASRAATRERLNLFTTNYDRFIEYGCDLGGLHVLDRFVGVLSPMFRVSRLNVDVHYNPPGIRGEPRYLEGVIRLCKLHGSLDWCWRNRDLRRYGLPFGAAPDHPDLPERPSESAIIYPNPAKDVETLYYPYAELFRDFASAVCRPNSSLVAYGYGFGDDHVNRVIRDMLSIPSTHLVIIAWDEPDSDTPDSPANSSRRRIIEFCQRAGKCAQISLLLGSHFGNLQTLVETYLPKPAIDLISIRETKLKEQRGDAYKEGATEAADEQAD